MATLTPLLEKPVYRVRKTKGFDCWLVIRLTDETTVHAGTHKACIAWLKKHDPANYSD